MALLDRTLLLFAFSSLFDKHKSTQTKRKKLGAVYMEAGLACLARQPGKKD